MKKKGIIISSLIVVVILVATFIGTTSIMPQESYAGTCGTCNGSGYQSICGGQGYFLQVAGNLGVRCDYCNEGGLGWKRI